MTIVLLLFLIMIAVFAVLYLKKQADNRESRLNQTGQNNSGGEVKKEPLKPSEIIENKIEDIINEARENPEANTSAQVNQEIISTINAEIIKQEQNKTPEQKAADLKAQEERQKIIDEINRQIREAAK